MTALLRSVLDPEDWLVLLIAFFAVGDVHPYRMYTLFLEPGWSFYAFWMITIPFCIGFASRMEASHIQSKWDHLNRISFPLWPPFFIHFLSDGDTGILWFISAFFWLGCLIGLIRFYTKRSKVRSKLTVRLLVLPFALFCFYYASEFLADQFLVPQHRLDLIVEYYHRREWWFASLQIIEIFTWGFIFIVPYSMLVIAPRKLVGMSVAMDVWLKRYVIFFIVTCVFAVGRAMLRLI